MTGRRLFDTLIESSGLPTESLKAELERLLSASTTTPDTLSMQQIRDILADYLQDVLPEAKASVTDAQQ